MNGQPRLKTVRSRASLVNGRRDWYRLENRADGTADLYVYDEIGFFGVTANDLIDQLRGLDATEIHVRLNSPGGEIFDGIAIYNALRSHSARVIVQVDSLAASIASVIAMAGDEVIMAPFSQMMIHDGLGMVVGNAADMREMADLLDRQSDNIAAIYQARAGGQTRTWRARMRAETWYSAQEAVDAGLADRVGNPKRQPGPGDDGGAAEVGVDADDGRGDGAPAAPEDQWDLSVFRYQGRANSPGPYAYRLAPNPEGGDADTPVPAPAPTPADDWATAVAHLTAPPAAPEDDAFARLKEGLLS